MLTVTEIRRVRDVVYRHPPRWLSNVVITGVTNRNPSRAVHEWCLAVAVRRKRSRRSLSPAERIPTIIDGVPVDVVDMAAAASAAPGTAGAAQMLGSGSDIAGNHGERGTATCIAVGDDGAPALITTAHLLSNSTTAFRWAIPDKPTIGKVNRSILEVAGADLYGNAVAHPDEVFQVEATRIDLLPGLSIRGGLPDGSSFGVQSTVDLVQWLDHATVRSFGAARSEWRTGFVRMLFPRRPDAPLTGMCLVQETGDIRSKPGDSGSLWVAAAQNGDVAVGLHWGFVWRSAGSPVYTFVTELEAALPFLRIASIVGDATWTTTT